MGPLFLRMVLIPLFSVGLLVLSTQLAQARPLFSECAPPIENPEGGLYGDCTTASIPTVDGISIYFKNYPTELWNFWNGFLPGLDVQGFIALFNEMAPGTGKLDEESFAKNPFERCTADEGCLSFLSYTYSCDNGAEISLVIKGSPILFVSPSPSKIKEEFTCEQLGTCPPSPTPNCQQLGTCPSAPPPPPPPPITPAPITPAPVVGPPLSPTGDIIMRPDFSRVRPDITNFEVIGVTTQSNSYSSNSTPAGLSDGPDRRITPWSVSQTLTPIESLTDWDFGDSIGTARGSYRTTYLYPRTSRSGTTSNAQGLPAYRVQATTHWQLVVSGSYTYEHQHCIPQPPNTYSEEFEDERGVMRRFFYTEEKPDFCWLEQHTYSDGPRVIPNNLLPSYGLTPDGNGYALKQHLKAAVIVQTDVIDTR